MNRLVSIIAGLMLIALGALTLLSNFTLTLFGVDVAHYVAGLVWAPLLIGLGLVFVVTPLVSTQPRSLGGLFIPGLPLLATGLITFLAALLPWGHVWGRLWPMVVLALAAAFVCLALYQRVVWILVPAIFIGLNGLVLQFCAVTGLWSAWAVLWAVEPLAVGFTLLLTATQTRSTPVLVVGLCFCAFSTIAMGGMLVLVSGLWRLAGVFSAGSLIVLGLGVIAYSLLSSRRPAASGAH